MRIPGGAVRWATVALAWLAAGAALPRARVAAGPAERADYVLRRAGSTGLAAPGHSAAGFEQRVRLLGDGRTAVTVLVSPPGLVANDPWPAPADRTLPADVMPFLDTEVDAQFRALAASLCAEARRQHEASWLVLAWVSAHVAFDAAADAPATAAETLEKGRGSCVGRSRLAVDLLRAAGIPARTVHGLLVPAGVPAGAELGSADFELHRFVESWIDGVGWVPSDPGRTVHSVDARHVVLAVETPDYDPEEQRGLVVRAVTPARPLDLARRSRP